MLQCNVRHADRTKTDRWACAQDIADRTRFRLQLLMVGGPYGMGVVMIS